MPLLGYARWENFVVAIGSDIEFCAPIWKWQKEREGLIRKMLEYFAKFQCIITDRYHGTIFSQIVNTPVVVISSADHKLVSGVKWFPLEKFGQNITFAKDLDEVYEKKRIVRSFPVY